MVGSFVCRHGPGKQHVTEQQQYVLLKPQNLDSGFLTSYLGLQYRGFAFSKLLLFQLFNYFTSYTSFAFSLVSSFTCFFSFTCLPSFTSFTCFTCLTCFTVSLVSLVSLLSLVHFSLLGFHTPEVKPQKSVLRISRP